MTNPTRYRLALASSYWLVFVIVPAVAFFLLEGPSAADAGIAFGLALILMVIGERGFRRWRKLWKLERD